MITIVMPVWVGYILLCFAIFMMVDHILDVIHFYYEKKIEKVKKKRKEFRKKRKEEERPVEEKEWIKKN